MKIEENFNIASYLPAVAAKNPFKRAVVFPNGRDSKGRVKYTQLTFSQLNTESNQYAWGFYRLGIRKGDRVLLMVRPSLEFVGLTFALFKLGAVPVLIDPGMGVTNLLNSIKQVKPGAIVAIPLVHVIKTFRKEYFSSVKHCVTVGGKGFWEGPTLEEIQEKEKRDFPVCDTKKDDQAAILFTTGSTGPPKGVLYLHGMFNAQVKHIKSFYGVNETDVDMPAFPLFALFSAAIGMTCIIPEMDPTKPAKVDPVKIIEAIENHGVTNTFGSPAIWKRVGEYAIKNGISLPSIKRILMAGAPIPANVLDMFSQIMQPEADTFTPYGATEALPIASISGKERKLSEKRSRQGKGTCVGKAIPGNVIKVIKITEDVIAKWSEELVLPDGEVGEIVVSGEVVTHEYFGMKERTELAKIYNGDIVWHRMGDVGYFDKDGLLWFCGRKAHRVIIKEKTLYSVPCEAIFNTHRDVFRSALVGVGTKGNRRPVIIIEPQKGKMPRMPQRKREFISELLEKAKKYEHTEMIKDVLFHPSFPVDIRHNVKIFREKLEVWAEKKLG